MYNMSYNKPIKLQSKTVWRYLQGQSRQGSQTEKHHELQLAYFPANSDQTQGSMKMVKVLA